MYKVRQVTSDKQYVCPNWLQIAVSQFQPIRRFLM